MNRHKNLVIFGAALIVAGIAATASPASRRRSGAIAVPTARNSSLDFSNTTGAPYADRWKGGDAGQTPGPVGSRYSGGGVT